MSRPKNRPGAKTLEGLSPREKFAALLRGKIPKAPFEHAQKIILQETIKRALLQERHDWRNRMAELADYFRDMARALSDYADELKECCETGFEGMGVLYSVAFACAMAEKDNEPLPTKADIVAELLSMHEGFHRHDYGEQTHRCDIRKQIARAERYLGIRLGKGPPGRNKKVHQLSTFKNVSPVLRVLRDETPHQNKRSSRTVIGGSKNSKDGRASHSRIHPAPEARRNLPLHRTEPRNS
jgi:hypothetical protein